ncbi:unannotated protein [freshwater metagenome]|uniref:Unannotated protein n=1 Tax=freshwater metagenome TaxID=449393 RepID=A0A6J7PIS7_9ZZZZ
MCEEIAARSLAGKTRESIWAKPILSTGSAMIAKTVTAAITTGIGRRITVRAV